MLEKPVEILKKEVAVAAIAIDSDAYARSQNKLLSFSAEHVLADICDFFCEDWRLRHCQVFQHFLIGSGCELAKISLVSRSGGYLDTFRMVHYDIVEQKERGKIPTWKQTIREVIGIVSLQEGRDLITNLAYDNETLDKLRHRPISSRSVTHQGKRTTTVLLSALINLVASRIVLGTWNGLGADDRAIRFQFVP